MGYINNTIATTKKYFFWDLAHIPLTKDTVWYECYISDWDLPPLKDFQPKESEQKGFKVRRGACRQFQTSPSRRGPAGNVPQTAWVKLHGITLWARSTFGVLSVFLYFCSAGNICWFLKLPILTFISCYLITINPDNIYFDYMQLLSYPLITLYKIANWDEYVFTVTFKPAQLFQQLQRCRKHTDQLHALWSCHVMPLRQSHTCFPLNVCGRCSSARQRELCGVERSLWPAL